MKRILPLSVAILIFFTSFLPVTAAPTAQHGATHVVQQGDTLYSIARQYGTTVDALMTINGLNSPVIWLGQVLVIGTPATVGQGTHSVVRGDTLYALARRYGTTVDAIMRANGLTSPNIYVGQHLVIPTSAMPVAGTTVYTVVRGDTLYAIAKRYGTSVEAIVAANDLSSSYIYVGQQLLINASGTPIAPTVTPVANATLTPMPTGTVSVTPAIGTLTVTPSPTPTLTRTPTGVLIQDIHFDGAVGQVESDEYAAIVNSGTTAQSLAGWRLYAGDVGQNFFFPNFQLEPGQSCRVYTDEVHAETCGFTFGRESAIWNNEGDCGYLFDANDAEVSRYCYE